MAVQRRSQPVSTIVRVSQERYARGSMVVFEIKPPVHLSSEVLDGVRSRAGALSVSTCAETPELTQIVAKDDMSIEDAALDGSQLGQETVFDRVQQQLGLAIEATTDPDRMAQFLIMG